MKPYRLRLGSQRVPLLPTWPALQQCEQRLAVSILQLTRGTPPDPLTLEETVIVLTACAGAAGLKLNDDEAADMIIRAGIADVAEGLAGFLAWAVNGAGEPRTEGRHG